MELVSLARQTFVARVLDHLNGVHVEAVGDLPPVRRAHGIQGRLPGARHWVRPYGAAHRLDKSRAVDVALRPDLELRAERALGARGLAERLVDFVKGDDDVSA